jgi:hypothetical protein
MAKLGTHLQQLNLSRFSKKYGIEAGFSAKG